MKHLRLTYLFLTLLLALMSASCKDDSLFVPVAEEESGSGVYVSVVVNTEGGNASRVGQPTPGEKGDDEQAGVGEENKVHDLTLMMEVKYPLADKVARHLFVSELKPEDIGYLGRENRR